MTTLEVPSSRGEVPDRRTRSILPLAPLVLLSLLARTVEGAETVVSLEFDDGRDSQYQVRDLLLSYGMRATFFINSNLLGRKGYMTLAQVHDLQSDGHEIGGHTLDHANLATVSVAEAQRQVCDDRAALIAHGFRVMNFAYPYSAYNETIKSIVAGCGYPTARRVGDLSCASCPRAETIPPADPYAIRTRESVRDYMPLTTLQSWVTEAEARGGGWVQIVMHEVCDGCGSYSNTLSTLAAFLDWLAPRAAIGTVVMPMWSVIDRAPPETTVACTPRGCSEWNNGPVTVSLSAADHGSGVAEIRYTLDGTDPGGPTGVSCTADPCSFTVSAAATVKYGARDLAGNVEATKSQAIRIDTEPPKVAITSPRNWSLVVGTTTVKASATDNAGIVAVSFFVDGRLIGASTTAPYQVNWSSGKEGIGIHHLHAEATDLAGNSARSSTVDVVVGPSF